MKLRKRAWVVRSLSIQRAGVWKKGVESAGELGELAWMPADVGFGDTDNIRGGSEESGENIVFFRKSTEFPVDILESEAERRGGAGEKIVSVKNGSGMCRWTSRWWLRESVGCKRTGYSERGRV